MRRAALVVALGALLLFPAVAWPRASKTRPCSLGDLSLSLGAVKGARGVVVTAGFNDFRGPACSLRIALTLRLVTKVQHGHLLAVRGNPARASIIATLRRKQRATVSWVWSNWCGSRETAAATVLASTGGGTGIKLNPPGCTSKSKPSTLSRR